MAAHTLVPFSALDAVHPQEYGKVMEESDDLTDFQDLVMDEANVLHWKCLLVPVCAPCSALKLLRAETRECDSAEIVSAPSTNSSEPQWQAQHLD